MIKIAFIFEISCKTRQNLPIVSNFASNSDSNLFLRFWRVLRKASQQIFFQWNWIHNFSFNYDNDFRCFFLQISSSKNELSQLL